MELLVPGLILVALMVYVSTRIKRSAARAFEAETVETDDFVIRKPEGFLTVIGGDERYAFEAYSKEFGREPADKFRLATATVTVRPEVRIDDVALEILDSGGDLIDDRTELRGEIHYRLIEMHSSESDVDFRVLSKLAGKERKVFAFAIRSLIETNADLTLSIEAMFDSFELK